MVANRHHDQAGEAFLFQAKLGVHDLGVEAFDRYCVEAHCAHRQQEVTHVQIGLVSCPLRVVVTFFTVQVGEEGAAFVVSGFGFWRRKTAIGIFLIHHFFQPGIVDRGFRAEYHYVRSIQHFAFVEHVAARCGFRHARFTFVGAGDDKVPRLGVGAGRAIAQQSFQSSSLLGGQLFAGIKGFGGIARFSNGNDVHKHS